MKQIHGTFSRISQEGFTIMLIGFNFQDASQNISLICRTSPEMLSLTKCGFSNANAKAINVLTTSKIPFHIQHRQMQDT